MIFTLPSFFKHGIMRLCKKVLPLERSEAPALNHINCHPNKQDALGLVALYKYCNRLNSKAINFTIIFLIYSS